MLLSTFSITKTAPVGANLIEQEQTGWQKIQTATGFQTVPKFDYVYSAGVSVGGGCNHVEAPIELLAGDMVNINPETCAVVRVHRGHKVVWEASENQKERPIKEKTK